MRRHLISIPMSVELLPAFMFLINMLVPFAWLLGQVLLTLVFSPQSEMVPDRPFIEVLRFVGVFSMGFYADPLFLHHALGAAVAAYWAAHSPTGNIPCTFIAGMIGIVVANIGLSMFSKGFLPEVVWMTHVLLFTLVPGVLLLALWKVSLRHKTGKVDLAGMSHRVVLLFISVLFGAFILWIGERLLLPKIARLASANTVLPGEPSLFTVMSLALILQPVPWVVIGLCCVATLIAGIAAGIIYPLDSKNEVRWTSGVASAMIGLPLVLSVVDNSMNGYIPTGRLGLSYLCNVTIFGCMIAVGMYSYHIRCNYRSLLFPARGN